MDILSRRPKVDLTALAKSQHSSPTDSQLRGVSFDLQSRSDLASVDLSCLARSPKVVVPATRPQPTETKDKTPLRAQVLDETPASTNALQSVVDTDTAMTSSQIQRTKRPKKRKQKVKQEEKNASLKVGDSFILADAGGGTVDVVAYQYKGRDELAKLDAEPPPPQLSLPTIVQNFDKFPPQVQAELKQHDQQEWPRLFQPFGDYDSMGRNVTQSPVAQRGDAADASPGEPLLSMFNDPHLMPKLELNPKTARYLDDPSFVQKLKQLEKNPGDMTAALEDPRIMEVMGVLLGIDMQMGQAPSDTAPSQEAVVGEEGKPGTKPSVRHLSLSSAQPKAGRANYPIDDPSSEPLALSDFDTVDNVQRHDDQPSDTTSFRQTSRAETAVLGRFVDHYRDCLHCSRALRLGRGRPCEAGTRCAYDVGLYFQMKGGQVYSSPETPGYYDRKAVAIPAWASSVRLLLRDHGGLIADRRLVPAKVAAEQRSARDNSLPQDRAPAIPTLTIAYTISQDRTGNQDEVCRKILAPQSSAWKEHGNGLGRDTEGLTKPQDDVQAVSSNVSDDSSDYDPEEILGYDEIESILYERSTSREEIDYSAYLDALRTDRLLARATSEVASQQRMIPPSFLKADNESHLNIGPSSPL